jgi:hypothetical protein
MGEFDRGCADILGCWSRDCGNRFVGILNLMLQNVFLKEESIGSFGSTARD